MNNNTYFKDIKRIAILSFEDTRKYLIEWSYANKNTLNKHIIISTARTASLLEGTLNSPVLNLQHGRTGGYQQVRTLLEENKIDILLVFHNTPVEEDRETWFEELVKVAVANNVVVGYNPATINMLVKSIAADQTDNVEFIDKLRSQVARETNGIETTNFING